MRLFGFDIVRRAAPPIALRPQGGGSWWGAIIESYSGAFQQNVTLDSTNTLLAQDVVYACISRIANDVSILRPMLMNTTGGIWEEVTESSPTFLPVLRKPNAYQTRIQFLLHWMTSKLTYGNTYILKERDGARRVTALYPLDARYVTPLITPDGDVYYELGKDYLSGVGEGGLTVPASEIIHDRMMTLWHPLVGVAPLYACALSATQARQIQNNSSLFFANMSRPSGMLTAPSTIKQETADRLKREFETNFSGANIGKLFVAGDALKYEPMTIPAEQAQLADQLKLTAEAIARDFHIPLHKLGSGQQPSYSNIGALNQDYYSQCLQQHIEGIELGLSEGLALPARYEVELELDALLRMDPKTRAETDEINIRAGKLSPNEARFRDNLPPVVGGESPYLQQQNYSLAALAKRDAQADPFATSTPAPAPTPAPEPEPVDKDIEAANEQFTAILVAVQKGLAHEEAI